MTQTQRNVRKTAKQGNSFPGRVVDVIGDRVSVQLSDNGAVYRRLKITGGPVKIGDAVLVDFSSPEPIVEAPGLNLYDLINSPQYSGFRRDLAAAIDAINGTDGMPGQQGDPATSGSGGSIVNNYYTTSGSGGSSGSGGGANLQRVLLLDKSTLTTTEYDATISGINAANAVAEAGDTIDIPSTTIVGDFTMVAGVSYRGQSRQNSIIEGTVTGATGADLELLSIKICGTSSSSMFALVCPASGAFSVYSCNIQAVNNGSGLTAAVDAAGSTATILLDDCTLQGENLGGGDGYAVNNP